jgi:hypothetical protein
MSWIYLMDNGRIVVINFEKTPSVYVIPVAVVSSMPEITGYDGEI